MTGRVFEDSANIYQDQARILFDYYKKAAETIVSEEMNAERDKADLDKGIAEAQKKLGTYKILMPVSFVIGVVLGILGILMAPLFLLAIVGIGIGIYFVVKIKAENRKITDSSNLMQQVMYRYQNIRRDYAVRRIGVVYVPVATRMPFEGQSFLVDHTGTLPDTEFNLTVLHQPDEFRESVESLQQAMESMPIVESAETPEEIDTSDYSVSMQSITLNDYVGNIDRRVRDVSQCLNDSDDVSVSIPVMDPKGPEADKLRTYATTEVEGKPVVDIFNANFEPQFDKFSSLNTFKDQIRGEEGDSTEYIKRLMGQLAESVQLLSMMKNASTSKLMDYASGILSNVLKASFNQYSPTLEAEEIERIRTSDFDYQTAVNDYTPFNLKQSSRVRFDMFSGNWVAEDGSRTSMPFGMHQVDEEVLMPVIASLLEENRVERLRIYNNIEDQKRGYLEKWSSETGNYFRDNRKTADELITHMREAYADYVSSYNMYKSLNETTSMMKSTKSLEDTEVTEQDSQEEMIAGFELQAKQCNEQQEQFSDFMDRIQENIDESRMDFAHIEYYDASLRDSAPRDMAIALSDLPNLDERRKTLAGVNPYIAKYAELPPEPKTSQAMMEDMQINLQSRVRNYIDRMNGQQQMDEDMNDPERQDGNGDI